MEQTIRKRTITSTVFVALFIATDAINLIATRALPVSGSFMTIFYALTSTGILANFFLTGGAHRLKMRTWNFVAVSIVVLYYVITNVSVGGSSLSVSFFVVFVLLPLLIPMLADIDVKILLRIIFIVPSFGILRLSSILLLTSRNAMTMGDCYALLIPVVAGLTYLMFFFREDKQKTRLLLLPSLIVNLIYFMRIVMFGSRGPILSVLLCFVFLTIFRRQDDAGEKKQPWRMILFTVLLTLFTLYFWEILQFVSSLSSRIGINIRAIDKVNKLREATSIWNGRDNIAAVAIAGIGERPLFGHGLSTFLKNTGIVYPHNFILQVLYDGGVFLFSILLVPLIIESVRIIRYGSKYDFALFCTLFFASVPGALFSGDCWKNGCLWLLVGLIIAGKLPNYNSE